MNILDEINLKVDSLHNRLDQLEQATKPKNQRIPLPDFCKQRNITRPTAMSWGDKKLIEIEKIGGRNYVKADSITVVKKWDRKPLA